MNHYAPLPETFRQDGFDFKILTREGRVVLLEKSKQEFPTRHFEVVIIRQHDAREAFSKSYPPREGVPPSEAWGKEGWSYSSEEEARRKFADLCSRPASKPPRFTLANPVRRAGTLRAAQSSGRAVSTRRMEQVAVASV
ncbi:MAG: hypothetical protein HY735_05535 [Verrucomicrobia bacterium]|nr:hypothetical protein [Verrucomicrobiota bacterium]